MGRVIIDKVYTRIIFGQRVFKKYCKLKFIFIGAEITVHLDKWHGELLISLTSSLYLFRDVVI